MIARCLLDRVNGVLAYHVVDCDRPLTDPACVFAYTVCSCSFCLCPCLCLSVCLPNSVYAWPCQSSPPRTQWITEHLHLTLHAQLASVSQSDGLSVTY